MYVILQAGLHVSAGGIRISALAVWTKFQIYNLRFYFIF